MHRRSPIRRLSLATIALLLVPLLVIATTAGSIWHHHADSNNEASCPICHLSHQPVAPTLAVDTTPDLAPLGKQLDVPEPADAPTPSVRCVPTRAPPAA